MRTLTLSMRMEVKGWPITAIMFTSETLLKGWFALQIPRTLRLFDMFKRKRI